MKSKDKAEYLSVYISMVNNILIDFQYIEESLRMFLFNSYEYISKRLAGKIPFEYDYKDIEKDSLGTLINKFEKLNNNKSLISELRDLSKYRNECAHSGFLLTYEQIGDIKYLKSEIEKLTEIKKRTKQSVLALFKEWKRAQELLKSLSVNPADD